MEKKKPSVFPVNINKPTPTCPEDEAYLKYIDEHRNNIYFAFRQHGQRICLMLSLIGLSYHKLRKRIAEHDISKYASEEFDAYRNNFFPKEGEEKDAFAFQKAWHHHYSVNDHHWQYWVKNGKAEEMDRIALAEMILDWEAMSFKFKSNPVDWYQKNKDEIILERHTRELVEKVLTNLQVSHEYPYAIRKNNRRRRQKK